MGLICTDIIFRGHGFDFWPRDHFNLPNSRLLAHSEEFLSTIINFKIFIKIPNCLIITKHLFVSAVNQITVQSWASYKFEGLC